MNSPSRADLIPCSAIGPLGFRSRGAPKWKSRFINEREPAMRASLTAVAVVVGTVFVVGCAQTSSPTSPSSSASSAVPNGGGAELGRSSARDVASGLTAISPGVSDLTLANNGWTCRDPNPSLTVCAPPGLGFPPRPPIPNNGGAPSYTIWAFHNHVYDHRVKFIRPDLYQGQPCQGDEPYTLFAPVNYYECIIPARGK